jgi:IS5 family transposase
MGLKIKKGTIQDATFITADPGHAPADKPRGDQAKARRSKEGTWTKKNSKSYFGFKTHTKEDCDFGLIRELQTTTASVHDSQVDLSKKGEVIYRDKGYSESNLLDSMQQCNGAYGITRLVSGTRSEINGSQKSELRERDHTPSSRPCLNPLIPWLRQLSGSM